MAANPPNSSLDSKIPLSLEDLRLLVSQVKDYAIFMLDPSGRVASWNDGAQRIKGYAPEEIIGQHMSQFYPEETRGTGHPQKLLDIARTEGRVEEEGWRVRKDGSRFWADVVITALRDEKGDLRGFTKVTRDLSERREAELALGELAGRLVQIQDDERRRISRELHDTTSPLLTGLTSKLYNARQRLKTNPEMANVVEEALAMAEATATMVRTLSSMLHPPLLDQSGLLPTLRWYLDTLSSRTGLRLDVKLPDTMARLPREREIALFRTTQEWLTNTIAVGAKAARVRLVTRPEDIDLSIEAQDGGWTKDVLEQIRTNRGELGIGIASMRERVHQLGGSLDVRAKEAGLIIQCRLPVKGPGDPPEQRR